MSHSEFLLLGVAFFVVATVYTTVGHAGASGYLATMGLVGLADELVCQPVFDDGYEGYCTKYSLKMSFQNDQSPNPRGSEG